MLGKIKYHVDCKDFKKEIENVGQFKEGFCSKMACVYEQIIICFEDMGS